MAAMITVDLLNCFILTFICFLSLLCYLLLFFKKPKDGFNLPPSPPSLPIIGHLHLLLSVLPHKAFQKISSRYGPLLHLRIFKVPLVLASSASVAYEIFRRHDVNVSSRGFRTIENSLFIGHETFAGADFGDYYKFMKKVLVMNLLGTRAVERSRGIRAGELERFYARLLDKARKKESVELGKEAMVLVNSIVSKLLIGRSCSEENGEAERVRESVTKTMGLVKKVFISSMLGKPLKKLGISLFEEEIRGVSSRFNELLERHLGEHEEKREKHQNTDMMDVLFAASRDENSDYKITRNQTESPSFLSGSRIETTPPPLLLDAGKASGRRRREICSVSCSCSSTRPLSVSTLFLGVLVWISVCVCFCFYGTDFTGPEPLWGVPHCCSSTLLIPVPCRVPSPLLPEEPPRRSLSSSPQPHRQATIWVKPATGGYGFPLDRYIPDPNNQRLQRSGGTHFATGGLRRASTVVSQPRASPTLLANGPRSIVMWAWPNYIVTENRPLSSQVIPSCVISIKNQQVTVLIFLASSKIPEGFLGIYVMRILSYHLVIKSFLSWLLVLPSSHKEWISYLLSMKGYAFSVLLLSSGFSFSTGLSSCVAVSTGPEEAPEITFEFLVGESWLSTSHYVTIFQLVVKVLSTHSSFVSNSLSTFYEGTDTTAHLIEWVMAEIISKPNIFERLRQEMDSVVGKTRLIQETDLPRLPYLQAVVKETLRLHPSGPLLLRMFEEECKVGGFHIPEKTTLVVNVYAVMRDPSFWEDPDEFKPERFLAEQEEEREKVLKFLPFGSGRRGCPGENLGYIFVESGVGMMVQCFDWRIYGDKTVDMEETLAGMSLTMTHPLICTHLPRIEFKSEASKSMT